MFKKKKKKAKDTIPFSRADYIRVRSILESINSLLINYMLFQNDFSVTDFPSYFFFFSKLTVCNRSSPW